MSASLVLVRSRWPQYEDGTPLEAEAAREVLSKRAQALGDAALLELYDEQCGLFEEHFAELDAIEDPRAWERRVCELVRARLVAAVEVVCGEDLAAEMELLDFDGKYWLLTGGMTFGDEPSACYFDVVLVGDSLIADAPVARAEKAG